MQNTLSAHMAARSYIHLGLSCVFCIQLELDLALIFGANQNWTLCAYSYNPFAGKLLQIYDLWPAVEKSTTHDFSWKSRFGYGSMQNLL